MNLFKNISLIAILVLCFFSCEIENVLPENEIRQAPRISILPTSALEADENSTIDFTVELSWDFTQEVTVDYQTVPETAQEGIDYEASSGTLVFPAGVASQIIQVPVIGENIFENNETLKIELSNPTNASILVSAATGTIENDDDVNELIIPTTGFTTPESYPGMELVWEDDFSSETLEDCWTHEIGTGNNGWGNNELQFYKEENTSIEDGHLVIEAREEAFGGSGYTSSRLITKGKKSFRYGRIDIRAVLPEGQGLWPALWMLGNKIDVVSWPASGEIDIMELTGDRPNRVLGTAHFGANFANHRFNGGRTSLAGGRKFSDEFHDEFQT